MRYLNPPFVVAVSILLIAAFLSGPVAGWLDLSATKRPAPLRARLSSLDASKLAPFEVLQRHVLEPVVVEALGTGDYLSWVLEDTSVPANDPLRHASLLITYYTGGANLVPHTPDVCYVGSGYAPAQPHENTEVPVSPVVSASGAIPVRLCTFAKTALMQRERTSVVYTFHCNGTFAATRTAIRVRTADPRNSFAYFSKVEISFPNATRAQQLIGAEKLFDRLLPVLLSEHWPDFEKLERTLDERA